MLPATPIPVSNNAMYKVQSGAASASTLASNSTVSSFSRSHGGTSHYHDEELNHTTQKQTIIGRRNTLTRVGAHFAGAVQAVSNLAEAVSEKVGAIGKTGTNGAVGAIEVRRGRPRAMTRTRSRQALRAAVERDALVSSDDPLVIGVQVQAKTIEEKRASAENAGDAGACPSGPTIATVIHASKSESEIGQSTEASASSRGKKGRPRTATGSGDALPPPPNSFATISIGTSTVVTSSSVVTNGTDSEASTTKQERRKSQTLGPAAGGIKLRNNASKRLSILRPGFQSPSGSPSPTPAPLSPSSVSPPLPSPRRSPLPSPSRNPSFPSLSASSHSASSSGAHPAAPAMREQRTTIEIGTGGAVTLGTHAGTEQGKDRSGRPALKRSFTHYARVLAKKLKRRTVSAGPAPTAGSNGNSVSSTASGPGILGVTTSTTVVEEVKKVNGVPMDADVGDGGEACRYPDEGQEIEIRVESDEEEEGQGLQKALSAPLPPSPSPVVVQSFANGNPTIDEHEREYEHDEEHEQEQTESAAEVHEQPEPTSESIPPVEETEKPYLADGEPTEPAAAQIVDTAEGVKEDSEPTIGSVPLCGVDVEQTLIEKNLNASDLLATTADPEKSVTPRLVSVAVVATASP